MTAATGLPEPVVLPGADGTTARLVLPVAELAPATLSHLRPLLAAVPATWEIVACPEFPRNYGSKTDRTRLAETAGADAATLDLLTPSTIQPPTKQEQP